MESLLIYQAGRYNIKGKQHLKTLEKYYVVDIGLRFMLLGSRLRRNKNNQCPRLVTGKIAYLTRFVTSIRTVFKQLA